LPELRAARQGETKKRSSTREGYVKARASVATIYILEFIRIN